jgi:universal stress protein F
MLLEQRARVDLERLATDVPPELRAGIRVIVGNPWQSIDRAAEESVDLIVIGSHGYNALDHVLGTTAAKVVNHADRSVLIVRD